MKRMDESIGDPYENLANAVIIQAVKDYRGQYRALLRHSRNQEAGRQIRDLRKFFHSDWFGVLTDLDPDDLIARLDRDIEEREAKKEDKR